MFDRPKERSPEPVEPVPVQAVETPRPNPATTSRITALIGASLKIKGDITGDENLVIEGQVEGKVDLSNHDLTIGASGTVNANLSAKTVHINGAVNGDIDGAELVTVSKSGRVFGNIVSPRVTLEDGAQFKGSIDMSPGNARLSAGGDKRPKNQTANDAMMAKTASLPKPLLDERNLSTEAPG